MAVAEDVNASSKRDWKKRESFSSALIQIGIVAALLAGAVYFIYQRGVTRQETADRTKEARTLALRDNAQDLEKALVELEALFQVNPNAADALALAADIHTELWRTHRVAASEAKARDFQKKAVDANSQSGERHATHALLLIADGKAAEADQYIEGLRERGASSAKLWYAQATAQKALGNLALARQGFAQAVDKAWKDPRLGSAYGEALLEEGQYLQALDVLTKATNSNPDHIRARLDASLVRLFRKDRVKDAADTVNELLGREAELTPGMKARALAAKAELAAFDGRYDDAIKHADEALVVNPDEHYALFAKARALGLKKDPSAAEAFKAAVAKRPSAPVFYFDGASLLQAAGQPDQAMALLTEYETAFKDVRSQTTDGKTVAALDRDDRYWIARGDVLRAMGKADEAMAAYDRAIAAENVNLVKAHYAKAALFLEQKQLDKAAAELGPITPPDGSGQSAEAYEAMGDVLFAKKDFATGCQHYAYALTRYKAQQAPREKLNALLEDVSKRLTSAGQRPMAKLWVDEAKPLIQ